MAITVRLFEHEGFTGDELVIDGVAEVNNIADTYGDQWHDRIDSVKVGSDAVLRLFEHENYGGRHITLLPGEEVANLGHLGFHDAADSLKIYDKNDLHPPY